MPHAPATALVTGSARRLGRHVAAWLVARGWRVVVHARNADAAATTATQIGAVSGVGADLRDPHACAHLVDEVVDLLGGGLHLLVNNAGTFVQRNVRDTTLDDFDQAMLVNARAPLLLVQRALPHLAAARGLVVNVTDRAAHEHWTSHPLHSASKAALESLTLSLAKSLGIDGVRVCGICPGMVLPPADASPGLLARLASRDPVGHPDYVTDALEELLNAPHRSGEIVVV